MKASGGAAADRAPILRAFMDEFELFDAGNPHEVYKSMRRRSRNSADSDVALVALAAIDDALKDRLGPQTLYVLDDRSVHAVLSRAEVSSITCGELRRICFELSLAQLVFRFTSAIKFKVKDPGVKQLRINSWGHAYCEGSLDAGSRRLRAKLRTRAGEMLDVRLPVYRELGVLLRAPITPQSARRVAALNRPLTLKVVS